jgi:hypothetical protein
MTAFIESCRGRGHRAGRQRERALGAVALRLGIVASHLGRGALRLSIAAVDFGNHICEPIQSRPANLPDQSKCCKVRAEHRLRTRHSEPAILYLPIEQIRRGSETPQSCARRRPA